MRQQEDDKSVSYCAVFVGPLASDDGDGGRIWVKMSWAAVEEQLAARPEFHSINDSESETCVTCSRRVTGDKRMEALGDVDIGAVTVELLKFPYSSKLFVPGDMVGDSMMLEPF